MIMGFVEMAVCGIIIIPIKYGSWRRLHRRVLHSPNVHAGLEVDERRDGCGKSYFVRRNAIILEVATRTRSVNTIRGGPSLWTASMPQHSLQQQTLDSSLLSSAGFCCKQPMFRLNLRSPSQIRARSYKPWAMENTLDLCSDFTAPYLLPFGF